MDLSTDTELERLKIQLAQQEAKKGVKTLYCQTCTKKITDEHYYVDLYTESKVMCIDCNYKVNRHVIPDKSMILEWVMK